MPLFGLLSLGAMFTGIMFLRDQNPDRARFAKYGVIAGAIGTTLVAMAAFGPMIALVLFAAFVAASFLTQFWS